MSLTQSFAETLLLKDGHVFVFSGSAEIRLDIADAFTLVDAGVQFPSARLTQEPLEVIILPSTIKALLTQMPIEIVAQTPQATITGSVIEIRIF